MPLKTFCQICGFGTEYTLTVPNFCSQCSRPLKSSVANFQAANIIRKTTTRHPLIKLPNDLEHDDEDDDSPRQVPILDRLNVEFEPAPIKHGITIGAIAQGIKVDIKDKKVKAISKKQALLDFQKQASALKNRESSEVS